jgi:hypothetical protein
MNYCKEKNCFEFLNPIIFNQSDGTTFLKLSFNRMSNLQNNKKSIQIKYSIQKLSDRPERLPISANECLIFNLLILKIYLNRANNTCF